MFPKMILGSFRISLFLATLVLISTFHNFSEAKQTRKLPSAVVVGTVSCDTCFQQDFPKTSHFISGALVAVECGGTTSSNPSFHEEVKTNEKGEFRFHLPFSVSKHLKEIKGCSVKLISSSEPYCAVASTAFSSSIHLKSRKQGTHIFSAGFFTFKPLKQPTLCSQKPSLHNSRKFPIPIPNPNPIPPHLKTSELSADTSILTTHNDGMPAQKMLFRRMPRIPGFPPNPFRPPPSVLPPNPLRPPPSGLPANPLLPPPSVVPPNPLTPPSLVPPNPLRPPPYGLPPNPFQPRPTSPSLFPPNPLQPPPTPPSILPPNPFRPPPSMIPPNPFPPVPGLTPPPSVLPPPAGLPVPVPPFQGPPSPGIPPAGFSEKTSP